jgi:hypothetical protein
MKTKLYQLDMEEDNPAEDAILIDEWNGIADPFNTTFFLMQRAPDCKIYMCSTSSTNTYHVIHKPDEKGIDCNFEQQGVTLPHTSSVANFPNFPNFRIDEEEVCDPTITSIFNIPVLVNKKIRLFPNPVTDYLTIETDATLNIRSIEIYSVDGKLMHSVSPYDDAQTVDMSDMSEGIYFIKFFLEDGRMITRKVVKI